MQATKHVAESRRPFIARLAPWMTGLALAATVAGLVGYSARNVHSAIDITLHYALAARISEDWALPNGYDPSLEELSYYPNASHRLAALAGRIGGSPLAGMQLVAMLSLAALWAAIAYICFSLPRRARWLGLAGVIALLIFNRYVLHAELFGHELVVNYFYPQLVSQAIATTLFALALWMERTGWRYGPRYLLLAAFSPIMPMFHLVPGAELLAGLGLLTIVDALAKQDEDWRRQLCTGLIVSLATLVVTAVTPAFRTMIGLSANEGHLSLRLTRSIPALATEAAVVLALSTVLIWQWLRLREHNARRNALAFKYLGVFGVAVAGLCLIQILALRLGYGSEYACKKYAFALNTMLLLSIPMLMLMLVRRFRAWFAKERRQARYVPELVGGALYVPALLIAAFLTILPPPSARLITVSKFERAERFAMKYREPIPGADSGRYDLAMDLVGADPGFDLMISIGVLRAPRSGNAEDFALQGVISKPSKLGRIFTREGRVPWDVESCRQLSTPDGYVILDGQCVLSVVGPIEP